MTEIDNLHLSLKMSAKYRKKSDYNSALGYPDT